MLRTDGQMQYDEKRKFEILQMTVHKLATIGLCNELQRPNVKQVIGRQTLKSKFGI